MPLICPKCGEVNSSNFLFCGMCGTILEPARKATPPVATTPPSPPARVVENVPVVTQAAPPPPPAAPPPPPKMESAPVPSISGPSLLGLDQSNNVDDLRDRAFSGLASYGHTEEPKSAGKEVLLTLVLLAALAGAGWWTYKNYIGVASTHKAAVAAPVSEATDTPPENPTAKSEKNDVKDAPVAAEDKPANASPSPETKPPAETSAPEAKAAEPAPKPAAPEPTPVRHEVSATRIPAPKPAPPAPSDGDALFRRGEGYLYARNGAEDCDNAVKYLKMAADKQHAKARSMMGTMYATGHCVPRDLPSSYRWFALALRVDPNNSILEKDLSAVWNQMTPPERQMATKSQ